MTLEYVWSFRHGLAVVFVGAGTLRKVERRTVSLG
jgi:hypothetical protein